MNPKKPKRIFWLGMHKVLVETEFAFLKEMGYEVFRPPYLSSIRDQSACETWETVDTTLPDDVIKKLSQFNFFYNPISSEIAKILNAWFDAVIVTIHPDWLCNILRMYNGTVLYRCFGQINTVSERLVSNGAFELIEGRGNFWFLPHAEECLADEQSWLQRYARVVPYWVPNDIHELKDTWARNGGHRETIALSCPNISNPYYQKHYRFLKENFDQNWFRYYGVQLEPNADPNVVGTLSRKDFLSEFGKESGYLYTYRERNVCYLPPIEMMILGGPVLYFPDSLLHRYFGFDAPGLVRNEEEAVKRANQLVKKDQTLISEIISSQELVRNRYLKENGTSKFKETIEELLETPRASVRDKIVYDSQGHELSGLKPVLLFGHFVNNYAHSNGEYTSVHGIPRVMRQLVKALNMKGIPVVVTAFDKDATLAHGFYSSICENPDLIKTLPLPRLRSGMFSAWRFFTWTGLINAGIAVISSSSSESFVFLMEVWRGQRKIDNIKAFLKFIKSGFIYSLYFLKEMFQCFRRVRKLRKEVIHSERWRYAIIPHYFLFPEALDLKTPLMAYIPDYMPHFFHGRNCFPDDSKHAGIGKNLSQRARRILTNSGFSKEYLPDTALKVPREKITSFLMPYLGGEDTENSATVLDGIVIQKVIGKRYIFYPTQPNPNKRLDLLVQAWRLALNKLKQSDLYLVLTTIIIPEPLLEEIRHHNIMDKLLVFPYINDSTLNWLYRHADCLGFSSEMEGNFPTQVLEALMNECPIVCMDHPLIKSELGEDTRFLLTAPFADVDKFAELILYAMNHREEVLTQQQILKGKIRDRFQFKVFSENVWKLDDLMASSKKEGECLINNAPLKEEGSR